MFLKWSSIYKFICEPNSYFSFPFYPYVFIFLKSIVFYSTNNKNRTFTICKDGLFLTIETHHILNIFSLNYLYVNRTHIVCAQKSSVHIYMLALI